MKYLIPAAFLQFSLWCAIASASPASDAVTSRGSLQSGVSNSSASSSGVSNTGVSNTRAAVAPPPEVVPAGEIVDFVLASVDGDPVTAQDLRRFLINRGQRVPDDLLGGSVEMRSALRELVIEQVVIKEAKASNIQVAEDELNAYVAEIRRQNGVDEAGFAGILREKGLTVEGYRHQVAVDILRTRLLGSKVRGKINILDADIDSYLKEEGNTLPGSSKNHLVQALFPISEGDSSEQALEEAEKARDEVVSGSTLTELDEELVTDLGFVAVDDLREELQQAVAKLKAGDVSVPIVTKSGVYLVQRLKDDGLVDESPEAKLRRDEAKKALFEKRFRATAETYLNDELPKKYHVELKL